MRFPTQKGIFGKYLEITNFQQNIKKNILFQILYKFGCPNLRFPSLSTIPEYISFLDRMRKGLNLLNNRNTVELTFYYLFFKLGYFYSTLKKKKKSQKSTLTEWQALILVYLFSE